MLVVGYLFQKVESHCRNWKSITDHWKCHYSCCKENGDSDNFAHGVMPKCGEVTRCELKIENFIWSPPGIDGSVVRNMSGCYKRRTRVMMVFNELNLILPWDSTGSWQKGLRSLSFLLQLVPTPLEQSATADCNFRYLNTSQVMHWHSNICVLCR